VHHAEGVDLYHPHGEDRSRPAMTTSSARLCLAGGGGVTERRRQNLIRGGIMGTQDTRTLGRTRSWMAALLSVAFVAGMLLLPAPTQATPGVVANVSLS